jgi:chorismate-pyruvate lyase
MQLSKGNEVIERRILLRGKMSSTNYIFAESIIALDRIDENFRSELLNKKTPIGKIWFDNRVETFKEIISFGKYPANELAQHFGIQPEENIISRTYCVQSRQQNTMMITEKFPESYFL